MVLEVIEALIVTGLIVGFGLAVHLTLGYLREIGEQEKETKKIELLNKALEKNVETVSVVKFSWHKALRSVIVGSITGLVLVLPQAQNMGTDTIPDIILAVTLVATVAGIDAIAKKSGLGKK